MWSATAELVLFVVVFSASSDVAARPPTAALAVVDADAAAEAREVGLVTFTASSSNARKVGSIARQVGQFALIILEP